ncbi:MAG: hypothetical protein JSS75_11330 [Bacteroidetes bacterium]|nr:hypothetical protein [Bacteroidota bacterium]
MDDSVGRGERQARALVMLVLAIEALWIFFHKYLPLDASLWSLQSETIRQHLAGSPNDGLRLVLIPGANILVPFVSGLLGFLLNGEVVTRLLLVGIGFFGRGMAMVSLLRALRVREALVFFLVPVIVWSGVFFVGSVPYLVGETLVIALVSFFLHQDHPRSGSYYVLMVGFTLVALCHALAFFAVIFITFAVASEQRRSVHLNQGWLSNFNRVLGLVIPGCVVLLLRVFAPAPIFMLSTSGFIAWTPTAHMLLAVAATPIVREAAFPGSDLIAITTSAVVVLLALASLVRAFLLPMEEVSWQSRSTKRAGTILLIVSLLGLVLMKVGVESGAFIWMSLFFVIAASYSRGPAVRRGAVDRLLRSVAFIAMIVAGVVNALGTNRGSEAAADVRDHATQLVRGERTTASTDLHLDSLDIRFVLDSSIVAAEGIGHFPMISYSATAPAYLYEIGAAIAKPGQYQPRGGMIARADGRQLWSPADQLALGDASSYFEPHLRVLAMLPEGGASNPSVFGPFAHGMQDTNSIAVAHGDVNFRLVIGRLRSEPKPGLAQLTR